MYQHHSSDIYTVHLSVDETKMIEISVKFSCTAKLEPLKARIWCAIRNERSSCDLLGIKARTVDLVYISCDDIKRETAPIGSGTYQNASF